MSLNKVHNPRVGQGELVEEVSELFDLLLVQLLSVALDERHARVERPVIDSGVD